MKYVLFYLACCIAVLIACGTLLDFDRATDPPKTASVCDYKVAIIYVKQFATEEAFHYSVKEQVKYLWEHGYEVLKLNYEYGYDMTHKEILRFVVISYRPKEIK